MSETHGEILVNLYQELEPLKERIRVLTKLIQDQEISQYPILILHKEKDIKMGVGVPLGTDFSWKAKLSFLEEFVKKGMIEEERKDGFIQVYKDPETHACIFLLSEAGANFVFYPI